MTTKSSTAAIHRKTTVIETFLVTLVCLPIVVGLAIAWTKTFDPENGKVNALLLLAAVLALVGIVALH